MSKISETLVALWNALPFAGDKKPLVTVIELNGVIGASGPGRKGLSLAKLEKTIEAAFKPGDLTAVALAINSPGGSPVQSRLIHNAIRRHAKEKEVPVLAFVEDVGASGGYILSIAGDEIYADESSIVGSIGVVSAGFGLQEVIARYGVERRVYTAGDNKSLLDPFKSEDPEEVARLQAILDDLHTQFIDMVKTRRAGKLTEEILSDDKEIFSGAFWTAEKAREKGLIDGIAQLGDFLRARYGKDVRIKRLTPESGSLLKRFLSSHVGSPSALQPSFDLEDALDAVEVRALWARFGL